MKIFDCHVHSSAKGVDSEEFLKRLEELGACGACVFSNEPKEFNPVSGTDFRL